jgi:hypothetical protein
VTRVPGDVFLAWIVLWIIALAVALLGIAAALPDPTTVASHNLWDYPPLSYLRSFRGWQLTAATALLGMIGTRFIVPYFGRVVRYSATPPQSPTTSPPARPSASAG